MNTTPVITPDRTRVLIVILGLALGEPLGGAERFGIELARNLDKERFEPLICAFWRHGAPSEQHWLECLRREGIEVFFAADAKGGSFVARYVGGLRAVEAHLQGRQVDVIHSCFQLGSIAALLLKRPLAARTCIRTGLAGKEWGDGPVAFLGRQLMTAWVFPLAFDAEVGVSQALVDTLNRRPAARMVGKRALLLPNGIPLDRFGLATAEQVGAARKELGLPTDALVVGNVGRLRREKGHAILLKAAAQVLAARSEARFVIIGDGELRDLLRRQAIESGLGEAVIFAGARTDVERLYRAFDLFVLPSLWEGLSTVVLESMASGVPVISTDIPGTRELIVSGRTGWLARPDDPADLARCILTALADPHQASVVAETARKEVVPRYGMAYIADQYEALYARLIGRAGR
jgi:glycosyltransferase involved in cell wall biosynthesis